MSSTSHPLKQTPPLVFRLANVAIAATIFASTALVGTVFVGAVLLPPTARAATDTDGDGLDDDYEIANGLDWQRPDSDHDELNDGDEVNKYKTAPLKQDTDGDGISDGREIQNHTNPLEGPQVELTMKSHINIHPVVPGPVNGNGYPEQEVIDIDGRVSMTQALAQNTIDRGFKIALRYWGDDPDSDDLLLGPVNPRTVFAAEDGLHFQHYVTLPHYLLDEDSGTLENAYDGGRDEIYVGARYLDPSGKTLALVESNRVTGDL